MTAVAAAVPLSAAVAADTAEWAVPAMAGLAMPTLAMSLSRRATAALIDEAELSPKPGLVDERGSGAHDDLTLALMCRSAQALRPWFEAMAVAAREIGAVDIALRERLGSLGRAAEAAMLRATGGVNTHRGAIWALGLLIGAAALDPMAGAATIAAAAGAVARQPDRHAPCRTGHHGERARLAYGVGGAVGQAWAGFPHVIEVGLPMLAAGRARGDGSASSRLDALLAIMSRLDDTCVLARGGRSGLAFVQRGAADVLAAGGAATLAGRRALRRYDRAMLARRLSPGGAADLLAATLFLDGLTACPSPRFGSSHGDL